MHRYRDADLDRAIDALWEPLIDWIHSPSRGKGALLAAYASLDDRARAALQANSDAYFRGVYGGDSTLAYRYRDRFDDLGGTSLTAREPDYLRPDQYATYLVHASDVMVHWAQPGLPLGNKSFGHEQEIILKPGASPRRIR